MPHQCLACGKVYDNSSNAILKGCECGKKLFLFVKKIPEEKEEIEISKEKKELILKELESVAGTKDPTKPIILKLENVKVLAPGKYEIDVNQLMKREKPVIYKVQDGTYVLDLEFIMGK